MQGIHADMTGLFAGHTCNRTGCTTSRRKLHLCDIDNVFVMQRQQNVDLSDGCERKPLSLMLHLDLLQSIDLACLLLLGSAADNSCQFSFLISGFNVVEIFTLHLICHCSPCTLCKFHETL